MDRRTGPRLIVPRTGCEDAELLRALARWQCISDACIGDVAACGAAMASVARAARMASDLLGRVG